MSRQQLAEHIGNFEERAAILEHEGGLPRQEAERLAAQTTGGYPDWSGSIVRVCDAAQEPAT
jgi:hypothetical protein